jgi:hypothetical protein
MLRFTLPNALLSLTYFAVAAGMARLAGGPYEAEFCLLYLIICCVTGLLGIGILIDEIEVSIMAGVLIAVAIALFRATAKY